MTGPFPLPPSDFGKQVAKEIRGIRDDYAKKADKVDPAIREQIGADLDRLAEKHEGGKP